MSRNIKNEIKKVSENDKNGIVSLYESLVSRTTIQFMDINMIRTFFPAFEDVDIDMILEEAFPAFEKTIGVENFKKVKKYFGIGYRKCLIKSKKQTQEVEKLVAKLRTMENAQYYISGYKELISQVAQTLEGAPKNLTDLEKAKLVRMYFLIYTDTYYFCEDYVYTGLTKKTVGIDYEKVFINNKYLILPEEFFILYISKRLKLMNKTIFYHFIHSETQNLENIDRKLSREVLKAFELELDENNNFVSVNNAYVDLTFGIVRNLKIKIHSEPGIYPIELFSMKHMIPKIEFHDLYLIYKIVKIFELSGLETLEKPYKKFEGSRIVETTQSCYQLTKGVVISGKCEKERFIRFMEYIADRGLTVFTRYDFAQKKIGESRTYNVKKFLSAIMFANEAGYLSASSTVEKDFEVASKFIEMDQTNALEEYYNYKSQDDSISVDEMKERLGIDEVFEFEFLGIEKKVDLNEIISRFAIENGYADSKEQIDNSLIEAIIIPDNEEIIEKYDKGEMDAKKFADKIGFSHEFGEMFFNLSKIDMVAIEAKLLEVKKSTKKINHNLKLLVLLYCYIVENQIQCGPKMRVPKGNKSLKTRNLRMLIS